MGYLLRSSMLSGFSHLASELGGDPEALLSRFNLPLTVEQQPDSFVPCRQVSALLDHAAQTLNCPDFGIRLSGHQGLQVLGPVAVLIRNTGTLQEALQALIRYLHVLTPAFSIKPDLTQSPDIIRIQLVVEDPSLVPCRQLLELLLADTQTIAQLLTGTHAYAEAMHFPHARLGPRSLYRDFFRCELHFDQNFCAIDVRPSILQSNIAGADEETARLAAEYLAIQHGTAPPDLCGQVSHLIHRLLATGRCDIQMIARQLHLHPRTLQRHLKAEGAAFEKLMDEARKTLAEQYLAEPDMRLIQVAELLGYADQGTLSRSCRRWFSKTPRQVRAEKISGSHL